LLRLCCTPKPSRYNRDTGYGGTPCFRAAKNFMKKDIFL
jgi:hypothetical protein